MSNYSNYYLKNNGLTQISAANISCMHKLGEGAFGKVFKGKWIRRKNGQCYFTDIAIKIMNEQVEDEDAWIEAYRMSQLNHQNILYLHGVCNPSGSTVPWMIMEYMPGGDLLHYLLNHRGGLPLTWMMKIAFGIACGMEYLHDDAGQYHGDLAARNCLIGPDTTVKIGDFGKFQSNYESDYYQLYPDGMSQDRMPMPLRWMPKENVPLSKWAKPKFSFAGDVWSYGVLLFEIWTRGWLPFSGLDNIEVVHSLHEGENPSCYKNVNAYSVIKAIMDACWEQDPDNRPSFQDIRMGLVEKAGHLI